MGLCVCNFKHLILHEMVLYCACTVVHIHVHVILYTTASIDFSIMSTSLPRSTGACNVSTSKGVSEYMVVVDT